jgi:hypothetical protein
VPPGILTGHESISGWRANGGGAVRIGKTHAASRELVQVGRLDLRGSITTEISIADIIRKDDHDVRRMGCIHGMDGRSK